jgi:WD40 repeat protein
MAQKMISQVGIVVLMSALAASGRGEQRNDAGALPPGVVARLGTSLFWQGDTVAALAVSADGKRFATAGISHRKSSATRLCVWEAATSKQLSTIDAPDGGVACLSFAPDGRTIAAGCGERVLLWQVESGKEVARYTGHKKAVSFVRFSPDGRTVYSGDRSATVHRWERGSGRRLAEWKPWKDEQAHANKGKEEEECEDLLVSADGKTLVWRMCKYKADANRSVLVGDRYFLRLRELAGGDRIREIDTRPSAFGHTILSPNGRILATGYSGVWLWDAASGRLLRSMGRDRANVTALAISADGRTLASSHDDETICLWDSDTGRARQCFACPKMEGRSRSSPRPLAFANEDAILLIGSSSGLHLWNVKAGKEIHASPGHREPIRRLAFTPDGRTLTSAGTVASCRWDTSNWKEIGRFEQWRNAVADEETLAVSADGAHFLTQGLDRIVRLRQTDGRKELRRWDVGRQALHYGIFAPDGRSAVVGERDGTTFTGVLLDPNGDKQRTLPPLSSLVAEPIYSPDSALLAWAAEDKTIHLVKARNGAEVRQFVESEKPNFRRLDGVQLVFSPFGDYLAVGDGEKVSIWDADSDAKVGSIRLPRGEGRIEAFALAPDGRLLATGQESENVVRLWEVASGQVYRRLRGHRDTVLALTFSRNGATLVSGSRDHTALVWDVREAKRAEKKEYSAKELASLWMDLRGDASRALVATRTLGDIPKQSIPFLQERLRPVEVVTKQEIHRLIEDLDSDEFRVREKASKRLRQLAERVEPDLRKTLTQRPSLEVRRRIDFLLADVRDKAKERAAEQLRVLRALACLEYTGTKEARALLTALSQGDAEAPQTREAKIVLRRLAKRR